MSSEQAVGFYSFLRYVPDPLRDEGVNVGLVLVSESGDWAKFQPHATKERVGSIGRREDVDSIRGWARTIKDAYGLDGPRGLLSNAAKLERATLEAWASESSGILRFSPPRVALAPSMESLWTSLWRRYITSRRPTLVEAALVAAEVAPPRPITGGEERQELIASFTAAVVRIPNFDNSWLHQGEPFRGRRLEHVADVAIRNGSLRAVGQAIPLAHGTDIEVIERRALLVDAALDVDPGVFTFGLYDDPPSDRTELLAQTSAFLRNIRPANPVPMYPRRHFDQAIDRFAPTLFGAG